MEAALLGDLATPTDPRRAPLSQRAGESTRAGDPVLARALESALRHRERASRATHGFHTYPAGLHPDAARELLALGEGPVLDPFCGGGTVLVEALLAGRDALGLDISPIAALVARGRTARTDDAARTALRSGARRAAEAALRPPPAHDVPDGVNDWYEPHVLAELCALRDHLGDNPLLELVFSAILVKVSRRQSDTSNIRVDAARPPGTVATLFHKKARELARMLEELETSAPAGVRARVHREDAREFRGKGAYGQIVTSPPYPGVYDYVPLQQLRLAWLGLDASGAFREEIGARRSFRVDRRAAAEVWREDQRKWVKAASRALRIGGRLIVVIGDGMVGGRRIDTIGPLIESAREFGFYRDAAVTVERWDEGVDANRPEHVVCFTRVAEG